ncbi:MAG: serine protease [Bacteroidetes bacterium]|nr:MAG: serine protease [Bacteroidota bacterium]
MKHLSRKQFIARIAAGIGGIGLIFQKQAPPPTLLWRGPVAGFQYHSGPAMLSELAVDQTLDLKPEPENPYDRYALALYADGAQIGYIPRHSNKVLSRLAQAGHPLRVRITEVRPEAADWEKVWVEVAYPAPA